MNTSPPHAARVPFSRYLKDRMLAPVGDGVYLFVFFVSVVGVGGAGIWAELFRNGVSGCSAAGVNLAIHTYYPAVYTGAALQILNSKPVREAVALTLSIGGLVAISFIYVMNANNIACEIFGGILASLLSLGTWWYANATDPNLRAEGVPLAEAATVGGDPTKELQGDTNEFRT